MPALALTSNTTDTKTSFRDSTGKASEKQKHLRAVLSAERSDVQSKPKRNRFSQKHRNEGQRLADALRRQRQKYPSFAEQLNELIQRVILDANRTRESDRERVFSVLRDWGALTMKELIEETQLSHWDLRQVLGDAIKRGEVIETRPPIPKTPPNAWPCVYQLKVVSTKL